MPEPDYGDTADIEVATPVIRDWWSDLNTQELPAMTIPAPRSRPNRLAQVFSVYLLVIGVVFFILDQRTQHIPKSWNVWEVVGSDILVLVLAEVMAAFFFGMVAVIIGVFVNAHRHFKAAKQPIPTPAQLAAMIQAQTGRPAK